MTTKSQSYRARARELRRRAATMGDDFLRETMLKLAVQFEELAEDIERSKRRWREGD